jgi:hypothetical protein
MKTLELSICTLKNEEQESKTGPVWVWVPVGGRGHMERVKEVEHGVCIFVFMYENRTVF